MFGVLFVLVVLLLCRKNHERVILFVGRHVGCVVMEQTSTQISKVHKLGLIWVAIKQDKCDSEASCISHAIKMMLFFYRVHQYEITRGTHINGKREA